MPELPEVETTRRGIAPLITGKTIAQLILRTDKLRWPLDQALCVKLPGQVVLAVERRAKYLLLRTEAGTLILHLGMSGSLRVVGADTTENKHDHVDLIFNDGCCLRLTDPRKFGALLWTESPPEEHPLLAGLGPEPLDDAFGGEYLYRASRQRKVAVKPFLMDQRLVVGVGNIYASEALFAAGIDPRRPAGRIGRKRYERLAEEVKKVLRMAIAAGGTTLSDFNQADGKPGYFKQQLQVYGRAGLPCRACGRTVQVARLGQRSTYFCTQCQR